MVAMARASRPRRNPTHRIKRDEWGTRHPKSKAADRSVRATRTTPQDTSPPDDGPRLAGGPSLRGQFNVAVSLNVGGSKLGGTKVKGRGRGRPRHTNSPHKILSRRIMHHDCSRALFRL